MLRHTMLSPTRLQCCDISDNNADTYKRSRGGVVTAILYLNDEAWFATLLPVLPYLGGFI
eukprot:1160725-Rhodomonas_salina.3